MSIDKFYVKKKVRREGRCEAVRVCLIRFLHDLWLLLKLVPGPGGALHSSSQSCSQEEALHSSRL